MGPAPASLRGYLVLLVSSISTSRLVLGLLRSAREYPFHSPPCEDATLLASDYSFPLSFPVLLPSLLPLITCRHLCKLPAPRSLSVRPDGLPVRAVPDLSRRAWTFLSRRAVSTLNSANQRSYGAVTVTLPFRRCVDVTSNYLNGTLAHLDRRRRP